MPTFKIDISDQVENLIDGAIKYGGPADFNPGQQAAWGAVQCTIQNAYVEVRIAGRDVDTSTNISVKCTGAEYISQAVGDLEAICSSLGDSIDSGYSNWNFVRENAIEEAFDRLG